MTPENIKRVSDLLLGRDVPPTANYPGGIKGRTLTEEQVKAIAEALDDAQSFSELFDDDRGRELQANLEAGINALNGERPYKGKEYIITDSYYEFIGLDKEGKPWYFYLDDNEEFIQMVRLTETGQALEDKLQKDRNDTDNSDCYIHYPQRDAAGHWMIYSCESHNGIEEFVEEGPEELHEAACDVWKRHH